MRKKTLQLAIAILCIAGLRAQAAITCATCPSGATGTGLAPGVNVYVNGVSLAPGIPVGSCQQFIVRADLGYKPAANGVTYSAFYGGTVLLKAVPGTSAFGTVESSTDVTSSLLATTIIGDGSACNLGEAADVGDLVMNDLVYTPSQADIDAGFVTFIMDYSGGTSLRATGGVCGPQSGLTTITVPVAPAPTCTAPQDQTVCELGSATFTTTATVAPNTQATYCWTKVSAASCPATPGAPVTSPCLGTGPSLTIDPVSLADAGCYQVTVTDAFGCSTTCHATLNVIANPICDPPGLGGPTAPAASTQQTYSVTITPSSPTALPNGGATRTIVWSFSAGQQGDASFCSGVNDATVCVNVGLQPFQLRVDITDSLNGVNCTRFCTLDVTPQAPPHIVVIKEVVCVPPGCDSLGTADKNNTGTHNATGIAVTQHNADGSTTTTCPQFCYRLTVINDSLQDVVVDSMSDIATPSNSAFDLSNCSGGTGIPGTLVHGQTYYCYINNVQLCADTVNTFTVNGHGAITPAATVSDHDTDTVTIREVDIECTKIASSTEGFVASGNNTANLVLIDTGTPAPVTYSVQITKSGATDVQFDSVTINDPTLAALQDANGAPLCTLPIVLTAANTDAGVWAQLQANSAVTIPICTVNLLCANLPMQNTVTVTGVPSGTVGQVPACLPRDTEGNPVPATSTCSANVSCVTANSCRVTGGGRLDPGLPIDDSACPVPAAVLMSDTCLGGSPLYTTHGGQLGAPYANPTCGNVAQYPNGDPCIRGQWQHVRHFGGAHNPQTILEVDNFHSNTPKGIFDMVQCACLPCCENPDAKGQIGNLCNPGDHKICGPEPRPAPDNAIIFTGVGNMTDCVQANQKNKKSIAVLFRVYVVDRSEPGGGFPKGGKAPPDVYCIQVWQLPSDPAAALAMRQDLADKSCAFIKSELVNTVPGSTMALPGTGDEPNLIFSDCGGLNKGNQQIHPSTSATCP